MHTYREYMYVRSGTKNAGLKKGRHFFQELSAASSAGTRWMEVEIAIYFTQRRSVGRISPAT